jgi:hypothetical protein
MAIEIWDLWYPKAAATGLSFARGRLDATEALLVHAAPDYLTVEVKDDDGRRIAFAQDLEQTLQSPVCLLRKSGPSTGSGHGASISREDLWPAARELGLPILLPGGEVGILQSWWNADDRKEWRWQIELYNSIR